MLKDVIFAGFGGQGVMVAGQILSKAAMEKGYYTTWLPSYGPEQRGGTANCTVMISDEPIASPLTHEPTYCVIFNNPSFQKFEPMARKGGIFIFNTSMITEKPKRDDLTYIGIAATELAEEMGSVKATNMILLGALTYFLQDVVSLDDVIAAMREKLGKKKPELADLNEQALRKGFELAKEQAK
ncbi:2-oxoacid:ferredoxin oxidoreductase subunit gamma [bacterium 3DAC]|nr:2-oxoacid:ferredoxin oxidoreductase subunit gamma [bacterium 3DAC]